MKLLAFSSVSLLSSMISLKSQESFKSAAIAFEKVKFGFSVFWFQTAVCFFNLNAKYLSFGLNSDASDILNE